MSDRAVLSRRIIETEEDLAEGVHWLAKACPVWAKVLPNLVPLPLRRRTDGFEAIANAIVGQQISVSAAGAIWARMQQRGLVTPDQILRATEDEMRAVGLSRPKLRYLQAIAKANPAWSDFRDMADEDVITALVALPGIGRWTAEIYLKFALGRADVFAAGDLALQEAAKLLYRLDRRPGAKELQQLAEPWRPWRAVAARGLWAYYRQIKGKEGIR